MTAFSASLAPILAYLYFIFKIFLYYFAFL